jgi:hypothetical protein
MGHGLDPVQEVGASRGDAQNNRTSAFDPCHPLALPQALGETHAAAVGGQKEEEEPRIRIVERWPISEKHCKLICIGANKKRYFSRPERYESRLCYLIYIFTSNPPSRSVVCMSCFCLICRKSFVEGAAARRQQLNGGSTSTFSK